MTNLTRTAFPIRSYDLDAFGLLSPTALGGFLQEAAAVSANSLGFGLAELNHQGMTWVLVREQFELDAPIRGGDNVLIETWPSGVDRRAALRDFRIFSNDREVGRALTSWLVLETASRRPVRPTRVLPVEMHAETRHVIPSWTEPIALPEALQGERNVEVRYSDIDANLHVTNTSYVSWVVDAVDELTWRERWLQGLDIQFLAECSLGSRIVTRTGSLGHESRLHSVTREQDNKEIARARSFWRRK